MVKDLEEERIQFSKQQEKVNQEIEDISNRLLHEDELSEDEKRDMEGYLMRLEKALAANEKEYIEAQSKNKKLILEMCLKMQNHINALGRMKEENRRLQREKDKEAKEFQRNLLFMVAAIFMLTILAFMFYWFALRFKRQKKELIDVNNALTNTTEELAASMEQLKIHNKKVTDSIRYARTIQHAILPSDDKLKSLFKENFVFYKPKDIVSGDFYWALESQGKKYVAVVDCTGHSVLGAFMSMLGYSFLNQILNQHLANSLPEVLDLLNTFIKQGLNQDESENDDGMDVCLCQFENLENGEAAIEYVGAKRPLYYMKPGDSELSIMKGNRRSIGGLVKKDTAFTSESLMLPKGSMLYLTSDGYIDQSGITMKYGSSKFQRLLVNISDMKMSYQKEKLEAELDEFMRGQEQRDDITILGLKV